MRPNCLILICIMYAAPAFGQLHVLTGSPFSAGLAVYPSELLRVEDTGEVRKVLDLVKPPLGTEWIGASYDSRKAVVLASWENSIIVVDFDRPTAIKRCKPPNPAGRIYITSWLALAPGLVPLFQWEEAGTDVKDIVVRSMSLDRGVTCEESFSIVEPDSVRYAVAHGHPGIAGVVNFDGVRTNTNEDGTGLVTVGIAGRRIPLGYVVPEPLRGGMTMASTMVVNDAHVFALLLYNDPNQYRVAVFRKNDKTWLEFPRPGDHIRGFGRYIATVEVRRTPDARNKPSAGMERWKPGKDGVRPDLKESIAAMNQRSPVSYPGRLHLYDVDTEQLFTIDTRQGDSEVLLVESGVVYYRAADQLFSAQITDRGIGTAQLLATDDAIRDAHWAFIKH